MIASGKTATYLHEPFNPLTRTGIAGLSFERWFSYVCEENEQLYVEPMRKYLDYQFDLGASAASIRSAKDLARCVRDFNKCALRRRNKRRPLVKDPNALFSAEWLVSRFDMHAVVLVRHPLAFAGSLKTANWNHPFADFLEQPILMDRCLQSFRRSIEMFARKNQNIVDQAILLWNIIYDRVLSYRDRNPDWIFVKHERLSVDPISQFEQLFDSLGISFSEATRSAIVASTNAKVGGRDSRVRNVRRDSISNLQAWRCRLSEEEISRVLVGTKERASQLYDEEELAGWYTP